ncbi:LysR family transcriptional regulator [Thalassobius sp. I31.1]|uniref:LysR family transcriptional regulator n=1 Tax=Thalassobius sp. I31.1 TaxID=2109912 RepID=UPI000D1B7B62|nr:LysR family transcriptional regulator [Thalassobius sp. I31.1]
MPRLDIDALQTLCAIADHGGVTRAADHMPLSQSAISHKIKRLEDHLNCPLLTRRPGAPLLTEEGSGLVTYARRILSLHDEALASLSRRALSGKIRLGMTEDVTSGDLSKILGRFTRLYPDVSVRTHVRQSLVLSDKIQRGDIDIALMQVFSDEVLPGDQLLYEDRLHWVRSRDLQLNMTRPLPFLSYDADCFYKNRALKTPPGCGLEIVLECASSAGIRSAVLAGLGVALLPARYISDDMEIMDAQMPEMPELSYILRCAPKPSPPVRSLQKTICTSLAPNTPDS